MYEEDTGSPFPQDAQEQLRRAVLAVFDSWETPRAQVYRRAHRIPEDIGTAVNVVQMVFGNKGGQSGTGVAFTRDPSTGEQGLYGEFLADAQGEDVVAGIRTPQPIEEMQKQIPEAFDQLLETMRRTMRYKKAFDSKTRRISSPSRTTSARFTSRTGLLPRKLKETLETPPLTLACGRLALIQRVASMKSTA